MPQTIELCPTTRNIFSLTASSCSGRLSGCRSPSPRPACQSTEPGKDLRHNPVLFLPAQPTDSPVQSRFALKQKLADEVPRQRIQTIDDDHQDPIRRHMQRGRSALGACTDRSTETWPSRRWHRPGQRSPVRSPVPAAISAARACVAEVVGTRKVQLGNAARICRATSSICGKLAWTSVRRATLAAVRSPSRRLAGYTTPAGGRDKLGRCAGNSSNSGCPTKVASTPWLRK